jgi:phage-related protein
LLTNQIPSRQTAKSFHSRIEKLFQFWYIYNQTSFIYYRMSREKPLHWVASAKKDYQTFPAEVQDDMGYALGLAQFGEKHPKAKPWKGQGPGVFEIVEDHRGDTYRAVYTVRFAEVIYVLHAFQKKSKSGIKTPQEDVNLIAERLKRAQADYENRGTT